MKGALPLVAVLLLCGCTSKQPPVQAQSKPRITATELFNLRTKCTELTDKAVADYAIGMTGNALVSDVVPHYDATKNRCYAQVTITKNFGYESSSPNYKPVPDDYLSIALYDVQTRRELYLASRSGGRSGTGWNYTNENQPDTITFEQVQAKINALMNEDE